MSKKVTLKLAAAEFFNCPKNKIIAGLSALMLTGVFYLTSLNTGSDQRLEKYDNILNFQFTKIENYGKVIDYQKDKIEVLEAKLSDYESLARLMDDLKK